MSDGGSGKRKSGGISTSGRSSRFFNLGGLTKGGITDIVKNEAEKAAKSIKEDSKDAKQDTYKPKPPQDQRSPKAETVNSTRVTYVPEPCPQEKINEDVENGLLDALQGALDIAGFVPGLEDFCDGINACIYFQRDMYIDSIISMGSIVFSAIGDTVLKPLRWATDGVKNVAKKIIDKVPNFADKVVDFAIWLSEKACSIPFIGKKIEKTVASITTSFTVYVKSVFAEAEEELIEHAESRYVYEVVVETDIKVDINKKPNVSNEKLKNIINDIYKGQGGENTIGNGTTMDAVRNEKLTGEATFNKFHTKKLKDYQNALKRRLRAGDLNDYDKSVVHALLVDIEKVLND